MQIQQVQTVRGGRLRALARGRWRSLLAVAWVAFTLALGGASHAEGPVINVNTATVEELQALPGVGATRANAILEARQARGGFQSVDDLLDVKGIGPTGLERLRPYARTTGPTRLGHANEP